MSSCLFNIINFLKKNFFKFLADTCPFLGPLVPLFWISGDVSSGFQSQSGFCLICYFCGGECNIHSPRFTSGATLADLLAAGMQPVTSPHACAEVGHIQLNLPHHPPLPAFSDPRCPRHGEDVLNSATFNNNNSESVHRKIVHVQGFCQLYSLSVQSD